MSVPTPGTERCVGYGKSTTQRTENCADDERDKSNSLGVNAQRSSDFGIVRDGNDLAADPRVPKEVLQRSISQERDQRNEDKLIGRKSCSEQFDRTQTAGNLARRVGCTAPDQQLDVVENQECAEGDQELEHRVFVLHAAKQADFQQATEDHADHDCRDKQCQNQYDAWDFASPIYNRLHELAAA